MPFASRQFLWITSNRVSRVYIADIARLVVTMRFAFDMLSKSSRLTLREFDSIRIKRL
jgi:hypothetical protein